jgi:hypothetical protein
MFPGNESNNGNSSASGSSPLFTDSRIEVTLTVSLACNILAQTTQKTQLFYCCSPTTALLRICCLVKGTCLPSSYPETALLYLLISWLLHSNGSTCYIAPFLRLFILNGLEAYHHFFFSKGCAWAHLLPCGSVFIVFTL